MTDSKEQVCVFAIQKLVSPYRLNGKLAFRARWLQKEKLRKTQRR